MADDDKKPMKVEDKSTKDSKSIPDEGEAAVVDLTEYEVPDVTISPEELQFLETMVRTSDEAQKQFLDGRLDHDQFAKAITRFGKPSNPSETFNRADDAYETKLPKWAFNPPEGAGLTMEAKQKEAEAHTPDHGPLTHEQLVTLPPEEQKKAAAEREKELKKLEKEEQKEKETTTSKS